MTGPYASPARVGRLITARRSRPPCPIFPDCRVDHLTTNPKGARRG